MTDIVHKCHPEGECHCFCGEGYKEEIASLREKVKALEAALTKEQIIRVNEYANASRLVAWIKGGAKSPSDAFTEGPERQVAYAVEAKLAEARKAKDGAYSERNKLVAALSKLFPASLERHEESDKTWEDDWRWIVFINLPTGQVSWHIHDSELPLFSHLYRICGRVWDGHTTEQKYERLDALAAAKEGDK